MNIFALSKCPVDSAEQMIDKHVIKMPTETCQMLHTNILYMQYVHVHGKEPQLKDLKAFHQEIGSELMKPAMLNHPSTIWARQSIANFHWLYQHGMALCEEYTFRYGKIHGSQDRIIIGMRQREGINHSFPHSGLTPVTIAMDDSYRIENTFNDEWDFVIESYRHYYLEGKWKMADWKREERRPDWFPANWFAVKHNKYVRAYNAAKERKYPLPLMEE
tara:strand:- start:707 stop:1360 length:654 start_codon:yes stop_codon:yes gene_type:complete